ncbi:transcriptional regulator [Companilactobacillus paralimentarius DSM 13238 = JCM 10415]|jgi:copper transport repressor, CopY/TcrY family|uniref:Transcriptional regulator n=1 Tax=Companilactobacillus paralimentarius DSM 13238 = JCM 10415 TaxID=1122151 RepID=A0A0R1PAH9_9LACO|nr:CopY/TcrY family copper transport repressor [Companilactobacillus paralimentarius]KAE9565530.1 uracil phosphoribosyltransferase [Companilactobacillus paralimentarius]KRL29311.1 transcriptional regulator [Companilactobacillus paralimentarius DSM 13238 = JCM 10415]MDR4934613.1 CopY/TcrY family copper transport repressor [Companilactobacillus paralimentarius]QFR68756.1 CopY/TcrY family copper transport repressor [Companilactobacillus paralimentarius]
MTEIETMSKAEWQVMRIIWTLGQATSKEVIDILERKTDWKSATIKTLIIRLQKKNFLKAEETKRPYVYKPLIDEDLAIHQSVNNLFDNLCCMRKGQAIKDLVQNSEISQSDISSIVEALNAKAKTAPEEVECNCLEANLS